MATTKSQAISGVSAETENVVMSVWPSIAATGLGRLMGQLYESIPLKISGIKLSYLLFALPTVPWALLLYFHTKLFRNNYVLTNRSVQKWTVLGGRLVSQVSLADIGEIELDELPGQFFYNAADLVLIGNDGKPAMTLESVPCPDVFRETVLKARDARLQVAASLATIAARETA